jgi:hypothetical protein
LGVGKKFRKWIPIQYVTESVSPADVLPEGDLVFFLLETIPALDLSAFYAHDEGETRGAPPFNVPMMCMLLMYSYSIGVEQASKKNRVPMSMDSGYFGEDAVGEVEREGFDPHIAVGRQKHHAPLPETADGPPPEGLTAKDRMAHKLRTPSGRACYAKRKHIVEPVFGQMILGQTPRAGEKTYLPLALACISHVGDKVAQNTGGPAQTRWLRIHTLSLTRNTTSDRRPTVASVCLSLTSWREMLVSTSTGTHP